MAFLINKKASTAVIVLSTVLIVFVLIFFLSYTSRECNTNADCSEDLYCGSDFKCHEMKIVEKIVIKNELLTPSVIIAIGLVITAIIFNIGKIKEIDIKNKVKGITAFFSRFFGKGDFPEKMLKDNYSNVPNPKEFGGYR